MTVQTMSGNIPPPFRYCWTHFWSTSWSSNYVYHISFQSLGSQESKASNGTRFGSEMKKLWPFKDERAKLSENFAAETPLGWVFRSCGTNSWHTSAIFSTVPLISKLRYSCEITFKLRNGLQEFPSSTKMPLFCEMISKLWNGLRNCSLPAKWPPSFEMAAKSPPSIEMAFKLQNWLAKWRKVCKNTLQSQGKLLKCH